MRFNNQWLLEWIEHGMTPQDLGYTLTMAGLELDSIAPAAPPFTNVVVGRVGAVEPHPSADRLTVCQVEYGPDQPLQVVCGASNVRNGLRVPFARAGARLPGGADIREVEVRGVKSAGMLCSAKELGLAETATGLMELPSDAPIGSPLRDYLALDDAIIEVDLTPNRADCLSVAGIAREVGVLTAQRVSPPTLAEVPARIADRLSVVIKTAAACPRYAGRVIRGINPQAQTPMYMRERLRRCGLRSLGPVVDVTNYVLLELGQPMHAFDLGRLTGGITVRMAQPGEKLTLLDEQTVELAAEDLVIADDHKALALAGIMGGQGSAVTEKTRDIFLESAFFAPQAIIGRARVYGLHTDSSHRFERGVDPELQVKAIERATQLLAEIVGGEPGPITDVKHSDLLPHRAPIQLRASRIERLLGVALTGAEVSSILTRLGCQVSSTAEGWQVTPPSFRFDLEIEADLVEELARVHGYDRIPSTLPPGGLDIQAESEAQVSVARLSDLLVDRGYQEAITFSFIDPEWAKAFEPDLEPVALTNPISSEMAVMRTSLLAGLVKAVQYNLNRQQERVRLFETGLRFVARGDDLLQQPMLAGVVTGSVLPEQWGASSREVDFFDIKGDVEALLAPSGMDKTVEYHAGGHSALHPGRSASIFRGTESIGWFGALHPELERQLGLGQPMYGFELSLPAVSQGSVPQFRELSRFPALRRDVAVLVEAAVSARQIYASIEAEDVEELTDFHLFDVYAGEGVPPGRKSIALGLILQHLSRTLTEDEVESIVERIVRRLGEDVGAVLRT